MAKPSLRARIVAAILAPLLVLGAVELGLRVFGYRYLPGYSRLRHEEVRQANFFTGAPELLWTLKPSTIIDNEGEGYRGVHTNSLGLRGPELPDVGKHPKILCLGDSITFGLGLLDNETWPAVLARDLEERGFVDAAVVNGGVPGWSSVQGMRLLDRLRSWKPDFVVFWFGMNDSKAARGPPDSRQTRPEGAMTGITRALRVLRIFQLLQQVLAPAEEPAPGDRRVSIPEFAEAAAVLAEDWGDRVIFVRTPDRMGDTIAELSRIVEDAEQAGMDRVFAPKLVLWPWMPAPPDLRLGPPRVMPVDGEPTLVYDPGRADLIRELPDIRRDLAEIRRLKGELDFRLSTLPESALGYEDLFGDEPSWRVIADNCHLTPRGAALAARAIAERIVELRKER